jgi:hypothetical protein
MFSFTAVIVQSGRTTASAIFCNPGKGGKNSQAERTGLQNLTRKNK